MFRDKLRPVAAILLLVLLCTLTFAAFSDEITDLEDQKKQIEQELNRLKTDIKNVSNKQRDVASDLVQIEKDLKKAEQELAAAQARLQETRQRLVTTRKELDDALAQVEGQQSDLNTRMRALYMMGPVDYIEVLFSATSFRDFLTRLDLVERIIAADKVLLLDFKAKKELVVQKEAELALQEQEMENHYKTVNAKRATIASRKGDQARTLAALEEQKKDFERREKEMEEDSRKLALMIFELQKKNQKAYMGTGKFRWPAPSSTLITSDFGWRTHPIYKTKTFHQGVDIGAGFGTSIVAGDVGEVIFSGWYGAYGNTVIIDHGGQISSQYSHMSTILVKVGDIVDKGDKVGLVGSTGLSTGPHLHFGVLQDGSPVDPWKWLK